MEPGSPQSSPSPEMGSHRAPEKPTGPEVGLKQPKAPEKTPTPEATELNAQPGSGPAPVAPLPQLPTLPSPQPSAVPAEPSTDSNPLSAADEDLVEKEWVDKAKKIVAQTKNDPYSQEKEVTKLQADYLKKRYGKELKLSSE